jgi:uncharacterized protein (TIGR02284 family)
MLPVFAICESYKSFPQLYKFTKIRISSFVEKLINHMDASSQINILNKLIVINADRMEGYETAYKETQDTDLKTLFAELQYTSQQCREALIGEVSLLGGSPEEGTQITGKFFRVWMDVKAALTGNDRVAILNSCVFGENVALDAYNNAIRNHIEDLTETQTMMLESQHRFLLADLKKVEDVLVIFKK